MAAMVGTVLFCRRTLSSIFQLSSKVGPQRLYSVTGHAPTDKALNAVTGGKIEGWLKKYEDLVGLTEVKDAQNKVIQVDS